MGDNLFEDTYVSPRDKVGYNPRKNKFQDFNESGPVIPTAFLCSGVAANTTKNALDLKIHKKSFSDIIKGSTTRGALRNNSKAAMSGWVGGFVYEQEEKTMGKGKE